MTLEVFKLNSMVLGFLVLIVCFTLVMIAMFFGSFMMNTRDPSTNEFEDAEQAEYLKKYARERNEKKQRKQLAKSKSSMKN